MRASYSRKKFPLALLGAAWIGSKSNRIILYRGQLSEREFEIFINYLTQWSVLRLNPGSLNFMALLSTLKDVPCAFLYPKQQIHGMINVVRKF